MYQLGALFRKLYPTKLSFAHVWRQQVAKQDRNIGLVFADRAGYKMCRFRNIW